MPVFSTEALIALVTLTLLEIVLGIDNIIFIPILAEKLPEQMRKRARRAGLGLAMFMRIGLLLSISWIMQLTTPLFHVPFLSEVAAHDSHHAAESLPAGATEGTEQALAITGQRLILLLGGL